jgi:type I restriction enzyme S subunit
MKEWKEYKLGDIVVLNYGKSLQEYKRLGGKIPVYSSAGITGWHNDPLINDAGIIIGRKGTIGSVYYSDKPFFAIDTTYYISRNDEKYNLKFLYYLLLSLGLETLNEDSAVPGLNRNTAYSQDILLPPLPEQAAIAEVLSSLDDKIDLLHRQNKTLEQLAETLFRQWFVEEAEESWEEKGLDEIAEFLNGLACQKFPRKSGENGLPVIKIKEMRTGITESSDWATADVPEKYIIENGDMLFSWSGSLDIVLWFGGKGVLNQHLFKVSSVIYPQWFYYFWTQYHLQEFKGIADDKATTMGHIQRHHLSDARVIVPPKNVLHKMDETVNPLFQKIKSNTQQIRTLTQLRDTLLPKLMSGEVRVSEKWRVKSEE